MIKMELEQLHHKIITTLRTFDNQNLSQFEQGYQLALFYLYQATTRNDLNKIKNLLQLRGNSLMRLG